ncbi:hypothetical protein [Haloferula sp. BvORR071]|uniref:hypothetical protein n=1 Tax=Haloferula sp. BvORR071 TaxID=1396141 RepID=UPI002240F42D|nr:hypothetical protein [Haloferula sp. BvORR071]
MPQDPSEWFEIGHYRSAAEQAFAETLRDRAHAWRIPGSSPDHTLVGRGGDDRLVLALDISDQESKVCLRTLRIEFDGTGVVLGEDETGQLVTDLDPTLPDVFARRDSGGTPALFASFAADWVEQELRRRIERHEWTRDGFCHRRWLFADTGKSIVWSDSCNTPRSNLGPPDRIIVVRDFSQA